MKQLLTQVVNTLINITADKVKLIFRQNIQIVSTLMHMWRKLIVLDKATLTMMLSIPETNTLSNLWRINAIEIIALAVCFDIPVINKPV